MSELSGGKRGERAPLCSSELECVTVEYEDAPDACTMYPRYCSERDLTTHWITAEAGSFVDLAEAR